MKDLLKIKWEMHKGVNYIFYALVVGIGILIGLGVKKIFSPSFQISIPNNIVENIKNFFN